MTKLYIICGHGAGDPGACGNGYKEAEQVRRLPTRIKELGGDSVALHPFDRNPYAMNDLRGYDFPDGVCIVEFHRDSAGSTARGAYVIIDGDLAADEYDVALADSIAAIFPGRANKLVKRNDLRNPNQAANRGLNYRLVENGFISNVADCEIFESRLDEIARAYLAAFGIEVIEENEEGMDIQGAVWGKEIDGKRADELLAILGSTEDPTGRGKDMNTHDHVKWIAAKLTAVDEKLDALLAQK